MLVGKPTGRLIMARFLMMLVLCGFAGTVFATFELADPANEMLQEQQAKARTSEQQPNATGPLCVTDADLDRCWCFDRKTGDRLAVGDEECRERAASQSDTTDP